MGCWLWLIGGMLWCSDGCGEETVWSRLRLAICPRWDSPAQWWAEWNLCSGQVCPARGYLSPSTEQSRGAQTEFYQEWWNSQLCLHSVCPCTYKPARMCIFWLRNVLSPQIKMIIYLYGKVKILSIIFILYSPERIVDGSEMSSVLKSIMIIKLSDWYFKWNW